MTDVQSMVRDVVSGFVGSFLALTYCLSYAALIFSGPLENGLAAGVAAAFIACAVTGAIVALGSGFSLAVSTPVSHTAALLAVTSSSMAPMLAANPQYAPQLGFAMLLATTLLTGLTLVALGQARLGILARYIPYPVLVGFLAATGWLITAGAARMAAGMPLRPDALPALMSPVVALNMSLTVAVAALLMWFSSRIKHYLVLPVALIGLFAVTHVVLAFAGMGMEQARQAGLLLLVMEGGAFPPLLLTGGLSGIDWTQLAPYGVLMATVVGMAVISVLLNATGMELATGETARLDRELKVHGAANIAAALCGGFVAHTSLSNSLLNRAAGGRGRLSALVVAAVAFVALLGGTEFLGMVPRFVLCGILLQLGLGLLWTWLGKTGAVLQRRDWVVAAGIVAVTAMFGFLQGVVFGLVASCVLFALDASTAGVVRLKSGLDQQRSSVERPANEMRLLSEHGGGTRILKLGGFVFFGSAQGLVDDIAALAQRKDVNALVVDFAAVSGMDSSAGEGLSRLLRKVGGDMDIFLSGMSPSVQVALATIMDKPSIRQFISLDDALEAAEETLLARHDAPGIQHRDIRTWLAAELGASVADQLIARLAMQAPDDDGYLCRQGDATETLLFVERGRVSVVLNDTARVRVFKAETVLGEIGFFLNSPRTAGLRSDSEARVWALDRAAYAYLQVHEPDVVNALLAFVVRLQAERLAFTTARNATLQAGG